MLGGLCLAAGLALAVVSLAKWMNGTPGAVYFAPVALFGVYAAVQFLRAKTAKPLLVALTFGALLDVIAFIAIPIVKAHEETQVVQRPVVDETNQDPDMGDAMIRPMVERLDTESVTNGITLLFLYAVVSIYLLSPQVRKHMKR